MSVQVPRSILIVLMGSIGDVARGLSLVNAIKAAWPTTKITWLVEPKSHSVVAMHPGIDEILRFERGRGFFGALELARALRSRQFDVVLDLQRHLKSGIFSWLSGAKRRVGFHRADSKEGNWLFSTETIPAQGKEIPKLQHYLSFLTQLGVAVPTTLDFGIKRSARAAALPPECQDLAPQSVGIVLGSSWRSKDWSAQGYDELIGRILMHTSAGVVLVGDGSMTELSRSLTTAHCSERVISTVGQTSLGELMATLSRMSVVCGPDSGPGHIAAALDVPYVGLFGPTDPVRTAPYGGIELAVVSQMACAPCYRRECPGLGRLCMRLLSPQIVFEQIQSVLRVEVGR
ncbi:MAG: glycosyltransferase family 9 protein [Proteobacteria bacterium]|nr:glycosyltransferase family 9 protein [Pseudomonadota bacterium]